MINFEIINKKDLYINGKLALSAEVAIEKVIEYKNKIYAVEDILNSCKPRSNNAYCFDEKGVLVWQLSADRMKEISRDENINKPITSVYIQNGKLMLYSWAGIEIEVNENTGEILSYELIK